MKPSGSTRSINQRTDALHNLRAAVFAGATWRYEALVTAALELGVTDEEIDGVVQDALRMLFAVAEKPVTPRSLSHLPAAGHFRH